MFRFIRRLWPHRSHPKLAGSDDLPEKQPEFFVQDLQIAKTWLADNLRPAYFGRLGGQRPDKDNRFQSWWGGNFLAAKDEVVPKCSQTGRDMVPVLQLDLRGFPSLPDALKDVVVLTFWLDFDANSFSLGQNGKGFAVRTYASVDDLQPCGTGYRESPVLPTFPVVWEPEIAEQPTWEDTAFEIPDSVSMAEDADWFFDSPHVTPLFQKLQSECPVKVGGWPAWIQGSQSRRDWQFAVQINATAKGRLPLGDSGSLYLFWTAEGWHACADCF